MKANRENRPLAGKGLLWPALAAAVAALVACGGGDGGSGSSSSSGNSNSNSSSGSGSSGGSSSPAPNQPTQASLQGTAATGAFMAGATVTVFDADGKLVGTQTADANGGYRFDLGDFKAPFAVIAKSSSGVTHVSVLAARPSNTTAIVNTTPLTTAIAALLTGGDPLALTQPGVLRSKAGSEQVQSAIALLRQALQNVATETGLDPARFDPIATPLTRQGEGADAVLDLVKVSLTGNGARLVSVGVPMGTDSSQTQLTLTQDALGKPAAALPKPTVKTTAADFEAIRAALQACFAGKPETRRSGSTVLGSCQAAFAADYKNSSYNLSDDLSGLFSRDDMTGARFGTPQIVFHATNAASQPTALLRLPYVRNDSEKSTGHLTRLATNRAAAGAPAKWELTGNQHDYDASVAPRITRVTELNPAAGVVSRYETGLRVFFNPNRGPGAQAQVVRVSGPGLPAAGVVLARSRVCGTNGYLSVQNTRGSLTYAADDPISPNKTIQTTAQNTTHVVLAASPLRAGDTLDWSRLATSASYPATPLSDAQFAALPEFGRYRFEVWNRPIGGGYYDGALAAAPDVVFTTMAGSGVVPPARLAQLSWNGIAAASLGFVTAGSDKTGFQPTVDVAWSNDVTDEPVDQASAFGVTPASPLPQRMYAQANYLPRNVKTITLKPDMVGSSAGESCIGAGFAAFNQAGDQRNLEIRSSTADDIYKYVRVVGTVR